ncbi:lysylphosphatidylglycerol synthase transmembrane domain-containing protein [Microbacterium sp. USHLN186]|uniref:lysylphosphatidylglycerol synthase transmembrane domain-containing protein n=1 Tax=Microbacterium sp. USHLN186 TaxID=3081286 RepID=UPI003016328A
MKRRGTLTSRLRVPAWLGRALQITATLALLVLIWRIAGGADALTLLRGAHPVWLATAAGLLMALTVLSALRWRLAAAPLGIRLSARTAIAEYFLAQLVNTTLPGGVLGDVGRAARARHGAGVAAAAGSVIVERAIGQLAMLVVLSAGFVGTLTLATSIDWPPPVLAALAVLLPAAWAAVLAVLIGLRVHPGAAGRLGRTARALRRSLRSAPWQQVGLAMATAACVLGAFACCAFAVGAPLSFAAVVAVVPLVLLAMLIPVSVAGWGVREGTAVALLPIAGIGAAQSLAISVSFGLMALIAALPGVATVWARRRIMRSHPISSPEQASLSPTPRRRHG